MPATIPLNRFVVLGKSQIRLMHKGGCLKRLARLLLRHSLHGQLAQLVIHQRQQLSGCVRIAFVDGVNQPRGLRHGLPS